MFCEKCGSQLDNGLKFCPECGTPVAVVPAEPVKVEPVEPVEVKPIEVEPAPSVTSDYASTGSDYASTGSDYASTQSQAYESYSTSSSYSQPMSSAASDGMSTAESDALASGVLKTGITAAIFACTFLLSFVGIIIGAIGLSKASKAKKAGCRRPKVHVGFGLSIYGIAMGAFLTLYFIVYLLAVLGGILQYMG